MRKVNDIELTGSEFRELKTVVSMDEKTASDFVNSRLVSPLNTIDWDLSSIYLKLLSLGLVEGYVNEWDAFVVFHRVTRAGRDFIEDYEQFQIERHEALWSDRKFQIGLSLLTLGLSALISACIAHCLS